MLLNMKEELEEAQGGKGRTRTCETGSSHGNEKEKGRTERARSSGQERRRASREEDEKGETCAMDLLIPPVKKTEY